MPDNRPTSPVKQVAAPAVPAVKAFTERWEFYATGYRMMIKMALAEAGVILVLLLVSTVLVLRGQPEPRYFSVDPAGRITALTPLTSALVSDEQVKQFLMEAIPEAFTMGFSETTLRINGASPYFTDSGFAAYQQAIKQIKDQIETEHLMMNTQVVSTPVLLREADAAGRHYWEFRVDTLRTMSNADKSVPEKVSYDIYVVRESQLKRPRGIAIHRINQTFTPDGNS